MRARFSIMLAALWWGSLTGLFVVVPMLFLHLGSPAVAGAMAARLFGAQAWLSTACIMFMLLAFNKRGDPAQTSWPGGAMKSAVAGLLLALLVEFGVAPHIVSARAGGGNLKFWHGLGSAMLLGQWLCAGITLWRLTRHADSTG